MDEYLDVPVPLIGDTEIALGSVLSITCPPNGELPDELEEIVVQGGTLTLSSTSNFVR